MGFLTTMQCTAVGCTNEAAVKVNDDLLCMQCAKHAIPSPLVRDARMYVDMIKDGKSLHTREETAAVSLARVTVMLALYGSKPESILDVIHQRGWTDVTIDDVYEIRNYVLEDA